MTGNLWLYLWVGLGSGLGGMGRYWISNWAAHRYDTGFPVGTLGVNVAGSLAIGVLAALTVPDGRVVLGARAATFFMVGVCGGFTTFSAFSLQTLTLIREGQWTHAMLNAALSVLVCLAATWLGLAVGQGLNKGG